MEDVGKINPGSLGALIMYKGFYCFLGSCIFCTHPFQQSPTMLRQFSPTSQTMSFTDGSYCEKDMVLWRVSRIWNYFVLIFIAWLEFLSIFNLVFNFYVRCRQLGTFDPIVRTIRRGASIFLFLVFWWLDCHGIMLAGNEDILLPFMLTRWISRSNN